MTNLRSILVETTVPSFVIPAQAGIQNHERSLMNRRYSVYILASKRNGTLCMGVTNNLARRAWQHQQGFAEGFTQ